MDAMDIQSPPRKKQMVQMRKGTGIPSLVDLCAKVLATEIETHTQHYIKALASVEIEYLKKIFSKMSYIALEKFAKSGNYKEAISSTLLKGSLKETEDYFRSLFASNRDHPAIQDPYLMLIPVFDNWESFVIYDGDEEEKAIPKLFPLKNRKREGELAISLEDQFKKNWSVFTENQLKDVDWNNMIVAGGAVLAALEPLPENVGKDIHKLREYYRETSESKESRYAWSQPRKVSRYATSDIDIFLWGLTPAQATEKIKQIFNAISVSNPHDIICVRTPQSITFSSQFPFRNIQIILRLYKSPAEVLMGFDLDCVTVAYDGQQVWALPRFHRAITRQYNLVDLTRRSTTYESRLMKYSSRGFEVAVPGLKKDQVDPRVYKAPLKNLKGLARLLRLETALNEHKGNYAAIYEPTTEKDKGAWLKYINNSPFYLDPQKAEFHGETGVPPSDYSCSFIPWGPGWNAERVNKFFTWKSYSRIYNDDAPKPQFAYALNDLESILFSKGKDYEEDEEEEGKEIEDDDEDTTDKVLTKLSKRLKWLTVDPGRQYIGSFHPEPSSLEEWNKDVYVDPNNPTPKAFEGEVDDRPVCKYGANCYRKNPMHLAQFQHPSK